MGSKQGADDQLGNSLQTATCIKKIYMLHHAFMRLCVKMKKELKNNKGKPYKRNSGEKNPYIEQRDAARLRVFR